MAFIVPTFTPEERAAREAARSADNLAQARSVAIAAAELAMSLQLSGGQYNRAQLDYLLKFCNAVIGIVDDGDCMACREILMDELRCDEDGNAVDENLDPVTRSSFGMHHPDSPSFGGL